VAALEMIAKAASILVAEHEAREKYRAEDGHQARAAEPRQE
jgi:hypothetical protein